MVKGINIVVSPVHDTGYWQYFLELVYENGNAFITGHTYTGFKTKENALAEGRIVAQKQIEDMRRARKLEIELNSQIIREYHEI